MVALRHEVHYGDRVVRCFAERPAHIDAMFRDVAARHPERDALVLGERAHHLSGARREGRSGRRQSGAARLPQGRPPRAAARQLFRVRHRGAGGGARRHHRGADEHRQRAPETEFILTQCEAAGLIYQGDLAEHLPARAALPHLRELFVVGDGPGTPFAELTTPGRCAAPSASPKKTSSRCSTPRAPPAARRARCSRISARCIR